jgi:spore coat protein SA
MAKVALVGPELFPIPPIRGGAAELFIDRVSAHFSRYEPVIIGPSDPELPARDQQGAVTYRRVPLSRLGRWLNKRYGQAFPLYESGVVRLLRKIRPGLIHVHNRPLLADYIKKRFPETPLLLHMHNLMTVLGKRERPAPGLVVPLEGFAACSRYVLNAERDRLGLGADRHFVIYNGVDTAAFRPAGEMPEEARRLRQERGLWERPTVLFVGKLRESKGVGVLVSAMEQVWRQVPDAALVLVGGTEFGRGRTGRETPFFRELQGRLAKAPGKVVLTGFVPPTRMPQAYLLGDLFVGPSQIEEGLGMVFLEAAAAGLPLIATAVGGVPEVVHPGVNGLLLARKDDAAELASLIVGLLNDPARRAELGRQGRERVCREFSWEHIARQQEAVYDALLQAASGFNKELH